jgi:signal transduction histidine kinase
MIAGFLSDRERIQRKRVEATKVELEQVYTELRQKIDQMKKAERLSAVGQLAASLAHEIRNPLASISGAAGILKRGHASTANTDECLGILEKESQRLNKLLTNFLDFARPRLPRYQQVDPGSLIESVVSIARHSAILNDVELLVDHNASLQSLECDAEQLKQVLLNLIINAVQATEGRGTVQIRSFTRQDSLCIEIRDRGRGVTTDQSEKMFDPFFTTKESGTGLGLAIATNIVEQHGGLLTGSNNPDKGMTFCLELPVHRPLRLGEMAVAAQ